MPQVFDADGNGSLDKHELEVFSSAFRKPNSPAGADNVDKIMQAMDFDDSDGKVQFPEFESYLRAVLATKFAEYDKSSRGFLVLDDMIDVVK